MILYAAYGKGVLIDQIPAENEDTALALLTMDYPDVKDLKPDDIKLEIVDGKYVPTRTEEEALAAAMDRTEETALGSATATPVFKVIEAAEVHIHINVLEGVISSEDIQELEQATQSGMVITKKKGA